jgi:hypothetical protein
VQKNVIKNYLFYKKNSILQYISKFQEKSFINNYLITNYLFWAQCFFLALIHFIHGYYCIYIPWQPLTYLYFPYHCISLIYFSFTKIRMFLYARIYWLAELGDVSCLTIWEWRLSLRPGRILSDNFKIEVRQNSVSDLRVWSLIHLEGSVYPTKIR